MNAVKKSIAMKLSILAIIAIIVIFASSGWWIFYSTDKELNESLINNVQFETDLAVTNVSETFALAGQVARQAALDRNIRTYLAEVDVHEQVTTHPLYQTVSDTLVDYNNSYDKLLFVWIANDRANFFIDNTLFVSKPGYDASSRPWYSLSLGTDDVAFTSPYADVGSGSIVVSAITAMRDSAGNAFGFLAADVSLATIPSVMEEFKIGEKGTNFLIGRDGALIYAEDQELLDNEINIYDIPSLAEFGKAVLEGNTDISDTVYNGTDYIVAYQPLEINGWGIVQLVDHDEAFENLNQFTRVVVLIFVFGALLLTTFIFVSIKMTIKPIAEATAFAKLLGQGDFTQNVSEIHVKREDEIGQLAKAFKEMNSNFRELVSEIIESSNHVATSSDQLNITADEVAHSSNDMAKTIEEIAIGATDQALNTEQGAFKTSELGELIEANKVHMESLNVASSNIVTMVSDGLDIVSGLTHKTKETNKAAQEIFNVIQKTDQSTSKIGEASNVIASIAQQTNLLALNAAIEAARAGDAGKGFAVVADEIRKLAEQSTRSTTEIDDIVQELTDSSSLAVDTINKVNSIIKEQVESVKETETKYLEISKAVDISVGAIDNLNISENNMESKKADILDTIQNLSAIAEENAASTEEASASVTEQNTSMSQIVEASKTLSSLAEELNSSVKKFKI